MTKIEWSDKTLNYITGCSPISAGCAHCYAERMAPRLAGRFGYSEEDPFKITVHPDKLNLPAEWKRPKKIFVNSMGDLFHPDVKIEWLRNLFQEIKKHPHHTFQILTKRPEIAAAYFNKNGPLQEFKYIPNVWFGVTIEAQQYIDRLTHLFRIPFLTLLVSVEPMLSPVRFGHLLNTIRFTNSKAGRGGMEVVPTIDWIICGAETGPGARPMNNQWARDLLGECRAAGIPFFMKKTSNGKIPEDLLIREFPNV